jgi:hypothetical protein
VVELYATLIGNYQALQTTAIVRGFSRSQLVYRNRFDYVSDLLPQPHVKSREEVKSDVEIVKAKYRGRKLTQAEKLQYNQEPFAGSMMSEPASLNATYCQGVAFRESKQQLPKLCP